MLEQSRDLIATRDHDRHMAATTKPTTFRPRILVNNGNGLEWQEAQVIPPPSETDRALWNRIADEIDAHLAGSSSPEGQETLL